MASRVEKYHDKTLSDNKRVIKNKDLYDTIYQESELYSNIEGVVETNVTNEIDLAKVKELISKQKVEEKRLVKKELEIPKVTEEDDDENNYDIKDVLAHAKKEVEIDNKPRKLKDFDLDGIKKRLNNIEKYTEEEQMKDIESLKELIETIAGNTNLNKLADKDLSLDMFSNLRKTSEISEQDSESIKKIINEAKNESEYESTLTKDVEMDKLFYTKTMDLKPDDFTENGEDNEKVIPLFVKILLIIFTIILLITFVLVGYELLKGAIF